MALLEAYLPLGSWNGPKPCKQLIQLSMSVLTLTLGFRYYSAAAVLFGSVLYCHLTKKHNPSAAPHPFRESPSIARLYSIGLLPMR